MTKIKLFLIISIVLMNGCVTAGSIEDDYMKVDNSDGISKEEARTIAQKRCLNIDDCRENFSVSSVQVDYLPQQEAKPERYNSLTKTHFPPEDAKPERWWVRFETKNLFKANKGSFTYNIIIDYKTGEILEEYTSK